MRPVTNLGANIFGVQPVAQPTPIINQQAAMMRPTSFQQPLMMNRGSMQQPTGQPMMMMQQPRPGVFILIFVDKLKFRK